MTNYYIPYTKYFINCEVSNIPPVTSIDFAVFEFIKQHSDDFFTRAQNELGLGPRFISEILSNFMQVGIVALSTNGAFHTTTKAQFIKSKSDLQNAVQEYLPEQKSFTIYQEHLTGKYFSYLDNVHLVNKIQPKEESNIIKCEKIPNEDIIGIRHLVEHLADQQNLYVLNFNLQEWFWKDSEKNSCLTFTLTSQNELKGLPDRLLNDPIFVSTLKEKLPALEFEDAEQAHTEQFDYNSYTVDEKSITEIKGNEHVGILQSLLQNELITDIIVHSAHCTSDQFVSTFVNEIRDALNRDSFKTLTLLVGFEADKPNARIRHLNSQLRRALNIQAPNINKLIIYSKPTGSDSKFLLFKNSDNQLSTILGSYNWLQAVDSGKVCKYNEFSVQIMHNDLSKELLHKFVTVGLTGTTISNFNDVPLEYLPDNCNATRQVRVLSNRELDYFCCNLPKDETVEIASYSIHETHFVIANLSKFKDIIIHYGNNKVDGLDEQIIHFSSDNHARFVKADSQLLVTSHNLLANYQNKTTNGGFIQTHIGVLLE